MHMLGYQSRGWKVKCFYVCGGGGGACRSEGGG